MENTRETENVKADWSSKGRGWIPDFPDIRDYHLDHENIITDQRLRREDVVGTIEDLVKSLLEILKERKAQPGEIESEGLKRLKDLQAQVSGGIYVARLKIYKILRRQPEKEEQRSSTRDKHGIFPNRDVESPKVISVGNRLLDESLFLNQITELKNYLNFLVLKEYLQPLLDEDLAKPWFRKHGFSAPCHNLYDSLQNTKWLNRKELDKTTEHLIKLFQIYSGIQVDGIVGYETYTTLNDYFKDSKKLCELKNRADQYKINEGLSPKENRTEIKLQTIPILSSLDFFTVFFRELRQIASEQILQEVNSIQDKGKTSIKDRLKRSFSESQTSVQSFSNNLEKIFEDSYSKYAQEYFHEKRWEKIDEEKFDAFLGKILSENGLSEYGDKNILNKIFCENFYAFEPIFSMVLKIISPLAKYRYRSIKEVIKLGFQEFKDLLGLEFKKFKELSAQRYSSERLSQNLENFSGDDFDDLKWQAQQAVEKAIELFHQQIELIIEEMELVMKDSSTKQHKGKVDQINQTLLLHLLLKKCLNSLSSLTGFKDVDKVQESNVLRGQSEPNIFDKQELFAIQSIQQETLPQSAQSKPDENDVELFQAGQLVIPVNDSFLNPSLTESIEKPTESEEKSAHYFFLPGCVDLSFWCPTIRDQGSLNSCTAFAGTALYEYFVNRSSGQYEDVSPLFLYKVTRQLMKIEGDGGASVRDTMKAMALFGIPPERFWPYQVENLDKEPSSFYHAYAHKYQALKYFRLDYAGIPKDILLFEIKAILTAGFPCMFGFTLYSSALEGPHPQTGHIPFPDANKDTIVDGHAVVAVGYDDHKRIKHSNPEASPTRGAILVRNSWGSDWGDQGYGWLPYDYVLAGLTSAWWSLLKAEWFQGNDFGLGGKGGNDTGNTGQL